MDALDLIQLIMDVEKEFGVEIPDEQFVNLTCCADVAKYIVSEAAKRNVEKP